MVPEGAAGTIVGEKKPSAQKKVVDTKTDADRAQKERQTDKEGDGHREKERETETDNQPRHHQKKSRTDLGSTGPENNTLAANPGEVHKNGCWGLCPSFPTTAGRREGAVVGVGTRIKNPSYRTNRMVPIHPTAPAFCKHYPTLPFSPPTAPAFCKHIPTIQFHRQRLAFLVHTSSYVL